MEEAVIRNPGTSGERLHALDAVRGYALLGGIVFHAGLAFLPGPQAWLIVDDSRSAPIAVLVFVLHMFRMTTFFLIAGFFGRLLLERRGVRGFIRNRALGIALPFVLFWPFVMGSIIAVLIWSVSGTAGPPPPPPPTPHFPNVPLTHLWFLYVLLLLYAAAVLLRGLLAAVDRHGRIAAAGDRAVRLLTATPLAPLVLALALAPALGAHEGWPMWFGIPTPDGSLVPNLPAAVEFSLAFMLGWMLQRQPDRLARWSDFWPVTLGLAVGATVAALWIVGPLNINGMPPRDPSRLVYDYFYGVGAWAWTFAGIGLALRYLSGNSAARRYIADASYWVYIVHLPVVLALQTAFAHVPLHWAVKFPMLLALAFGICFASYHLLVRRSFIGQWLNGRRYPARAAQMGPQSLDGAT